MEQLQVVHLAKQVKIELMLQHQRVVPAFARMDFTKMLQMFFAFPAIFLV